MIVIVVSYSLVEQDRVITDIVTISFDIDI